MSYVIIGLASYAIIAAAVLALAHAAGRSSRWEERQQPCEVCEDTYTDQQLEGVYICPSCLYLIRRNLAEQEWPQDAA